MRPARTTKPRPGLSVLVVEDNPDCASSMAALLSLTGHDAAVAADGPAAVEKARETPPDVVLLNIGLPGIDGFEVARRLRAQPGKPPFIIAVSGYGQDEDRRRSAEAGVDIHLLKPADPAQLLGILGRFRLVSTQGAPREPRALTVRTSRS